MINYKYAVDDDEYQLTFKSERKYDFDDPLDMEFLANVMGEDYHDNHDGWESRYPINITIINHGVKVATFSVYREYEPVFSAYKIED